MFLKVSLLLKTYYFAHILTQFKLTILIFIGIFLNVKDSSNSLVTAITFSLVHLFTTSFFVIPLLHYVIKSTFKQHYNKSLLAPLGFKLLRQHPIGYIYQALQLLFFTTALYTDSLEVTSKALPITLCAAGIFCIFMSRYTSIKVFNDHILYKNKEIFFNEILTLETSVEKYLKIKLKNKKEYVINKNSYIKLSPLLQEKLEYDSRF